MVLETLLLLLPCALSNTAKISDTVFFTWYVHLCLPKPLETLLKFAFHPLLLKFLNQKDSSFEHFHHPLSSPLFFSSHTPAHFLILSSLQGLLMYQLQLTTSQVGLQDISEHWGAAGSLSASSLTTPPAQTLFHGLHWCLVPGRQRDTWPNHRNSSSCRLPDAHHGEKPGQRWRSSSGATTSTYAHIHL